MPRATTPAATKKKPSPKAASTSSSKAAKAVKPVKRANPKAAAKDPAVKGAVKATGRVAAKAAKPAVVKKARTARAKSPFGAKFLAVQEKALLEERRTYLRQSESLRAEADSLVADFESGDVQFDEESGEGDTLNIERERDLALSAQARHAVEEIDHALAKFATGMYGICEVSGDPIPEERLEAIPWVRERVEYKIGGFARRE